MDEPTISLSGGGQGDGPLHKWGPFDLVERVGQGGFGEVYRAYDPALQRVVAVKLLFPRPGRHDEQTAAILRESRAMARVIHPNVLPIYGVQTYDGRVGFWSAFVRGKTLSALLSANGPFGPREVVHIGVDLCRALSAVHGAGLLHRDIKAGNAMREEGGRILLMDFGLTHERDGDSHSGGTPGYIAPELRGGMKASVRSDIYALGVLLYHLLTGKYPPEDSGATWNLLEKRPDLLPGLVRVIHTAIDPDPEKRFSSAAQMAAALDSDSGVASTPAAGFSKWNRYAIAAALLLVVAGAVYQFRSPRFPATGNSAGADLQKRYDAAHDLVQHYEQPRALENAIPMLEAMSREAPAFAPALADLGRANYLLFIRDNDSKYVAPAEKASLDSITINPNQAAAHVTLGMLYTQLGSNDLATGQLDAAAKVDRLDAEVLGARAQLYRRQGLTGNIEPTLKDAIDLAPKDWRWPNELADYYDRKGRYADAIAEERIALRLAPNNARVLNNLGLYLKVAGNLEEARIELKKAIAIEPGYNRYSNLGAVERDLGNYPGAIAMFQSAIGQNPDNYRAYDALADIYKRQKDTAKMLETYRKAIDVAEELRKTEPKNTTLLADLGMMYAETGNFPEAIRLLKQAVRLEPENVEMLFESGLVYEMAHDRVDAITQIGAALRHGYPLKSVERVPELALLRTDKKYLAIMASLR